MAVPRWAVSFADLGLVLIACFVMLNAMEAARPKADSDAVRVPAPVASIPAETYRAEELFEPGEARLTEAARAELRAAGGRWAGRPIRIVSRGAGTGSARLDRFELAAARSAAVARGVARGRRPGGRRGGGAGRVREFGRANHRHRGPLRHTNPAHPE